MDEQLPKPKQNDLLRMARKQRNLTQHQLAEILNVSDDTVRSWERGRRFPSTELLQKLSDFFLMSPSALGFEAPKGAEEKEVLSSNENSTVRHARINRRRMIRHVRSIWIDGVLHESLHRAALIDLGLQERPDALENPWRLAVQETNRPHRILPPNTTITQVYDEADGELLLLGEPGAGKTTLLLELVRTLLTRAEQDEEQPIPVVFNLSSWATNQPPLVDWLVEELSTKYHVPPPLALRWLQDDQLTILLDGLDEVTQTNRAACVNAINLYRSQHEIVSLVVCCRMMEYYAVETRVEFQQAVMIQPLTIEQIHQYLGSIGKQLESVRKALEEDGDLQEMAKSPLMLSILTLTYQGHDNTSKNISLTGSPDARRRQVLDQYVRRMLTRRAQSRYTESQTVHWLSWLARQMQQRSLTEFYLERMQPDWLSGGPPRDRYHNMALRFIYSIEAIVIITLFAWMRGGKVGNTFGVGAGLLGELGAGRGNTIFAWMSPGVGGGVEAGGSLGVIFALVYCLQALLISAPTFPILTWKSGWRGLRNGLKSGLITGGIVSIFCVPIFTFLGGIAHGLTYGIGMGLFGGLLIGLLSGLIAGLQDESVQLPQGQRHHRPFRSRLMDGILIGFCAGLSFSLVDVALRIVMQSVIAYGIIAGFFCFCSFGLAGGSNLIPLGTIKPAESVSWSWANIKRMLPETLIRGLLSSLFITLCVGVIIALASGVFYGFNYGARYGLIYGLIIGLVGCLAGVLASLLNSGWSSDMLNAHQTMSPNEGIRRSLLNAVFAGLLFGPVGGVISGIVCSIAFGAIGGLTGWLILGAGFSFVFGLLTGVQFALIHGGIAWIEHYLLRWHFWRASFMPANYVKFLDHAAERIFLRKVGGGYMFAHRLLLDYFASLDQPTSGTP